MEGYLPDGLTSLTAWGGFLFGRNKGTGAGHAASEISKGNGSGKGAAQKSQIISARQLDIVRMYPRVYVVGKPWERRTEKEAHRNNVGDLGKLFSSRFGRHYLMLNLSAGANNQVDYYRLRHQVLECDLESQPSLESLFMLCHAIQVWLDLDSDNVIAIFCKNGVHTCRLLLSAYLTFNKEFKSTEEALQQFYYKRVRVNYDAQHILTRAQPSLQHFLRQFEKTLHNNGPPQTKPIALSMLVIENLPRITEKDLLESNIFSLFGLSSDDSDKLAQPIIRIYQHRGLQDRALIYSSLSDPESCVYWNAPVGKLILKCNCQLWGDAEIDCVFPGNTNKHLFKFYFHTGFLSNKGVVVFTRKDLHTGNKHVFSESFKIDMMLEPGDLKAHNGSFPSLSYLCPKLDQDKALRILSDLHFLKPDPKLCCELVADGISELRARFALQRASNDIGVARSLLQVSEGATDVVREGQQQGSNFGDLNEIEQKENKTSYPPKQQQHQQAGPSKIHQTSTGSLPLIKDEDMTNELNSMLDKLHENAKALPQVQTNPKQILSNKIGHPVLSNQEKNKTSLSCELDPTVISSPPQNQDTVQETSPSSCSETSANLKVEKCHDLSSPEDLESQKCTSKCVTEAPPLVRVASLRLAQTQTKSAPESPSLSKQIYVDTTNEIKVSDNASLDGFPTRHVNQEESDNTSAVDKLIMRNHIKEALPCSMSIQSSLNETEIGPETLSCEDIDDSREEDSASSPLTLGSFLEKRYPTLRKNSEPGSSKGEMVIQDDPRQTLLEKFSKLDKSSSCNSPSSTQHHSTEIPISNKLKQPPFQGTSASKTAPKINEHLNPRETLMRMIANRQGGDISISNKVHNIQREDPRKALMNMIAKRQGSDSVPNQDSVSKENHGGPLMDTVCQNPSIEQDQNNHNPKAKEVLQKATPQENLLGMLTKRCQTSQANTSCSVKAAEVVAEPTEEDVTTKASIVAKYKRMLSVGVPEGAVRTKMMQDSVDPALLFGGNSSDSGGNEIRGAPPPEYEKFSKMLKMGVPAGAVEAKMRLENLDPTWIGLGNRACSESKKLGTPVKDRIRRKKFHWEAIPESRLKQDSIWAVSRNIAKFRRNSARKERNERRASIESASSNEGRLSPTCVMSDETDLDMKELEQLFTQNPNANKAPKQIAQGLKKAAAPKCVSLLDMKRSQNVSIGLKKIKLSGDAICEALNNFKSSVLTQERLQIIKSAQMLPTQEESKIIGGYRGDLTKLGDAEQFFRKIVDSVHRPEIHLDAMLFRAEYDERLLELKGKVDLVRQACTSVRDSESLQKVFQIVLLVGNKINAEGSSSIQGFTVASLLKLSQTKSFNRKTTILDFIAQFAVKRIPEVLEVDKELEILGRAKRFSFAIFEADESGLHMGYQSILRATKQTESQVTSGLEDLFIFSNHVQNSLSCLEADMDQMRAEYAALLEFFCEEPDLSVQDFFATLDTFLKSFGVTARNFDEKRRRQQSRERAERERSLKRSESVGSGMLRRSSMEQSQLKMTPKSKSFKNSSSPRILSPSFAHSLKESRFITPRREISKETKSQEEDLGDENENNMNWKKKAGVFNKPSTFHTPGDSTAKRSKPLSETPCLSRFLANSPTTPEHASESACSLQILKRTSKSPIVESS